MYIININIRMYSLLLSYKCGGQNYLLVGMPHACIVPVYWMVGPRRSHWKVMSREVTSFVTKLPTSITREQPTLYVFKKNHGSYESGSGNHPVGTWSSRQDLLGCRMIREHHVFALVQLLKPPSGNIPPLLKYVRLAFPWNTIHMKTVDFSAVMTILSGKVMIHDQPIHHPTCRRFSHHFPTIFPPCSPPWAPAIPTLQNVSVLRLLGNLHFAAEATHRAMAIGIDRAGRWWETLPNFHGLC